MFAASSARPEEDDEKPEIDTNLSLAAFQSKYTSEDNESFYKLLDKQNSKRAEKYAWLWAGNKLPSKMQLAQKKVEAKLLESGRSLEDDGFKKERLVIKGKDDRPAQPDTWNAPPNNALMFAPDGVSDNLETQIQVAEATSRAPPKAVNYQNTRLPAPHVIGDEETIPPTPSEHVCNWGAVALRVAASPRGRPYIAVEAHVLETRDHGQGGSDIRA